MSLLVTLLRCFLTSRGHKEAPGKTKGRGVPITHQTKAFEAEGEIERHPCLEAVVLGSSRVGLLVLLQGEKERERGSWTV